MIFVGLVATPAVTTLTVERGVVALNLVVSAPCRFVTPKTDIAVGAGFLEAKTSTFGTISRFQCRDARSDDPYSGRGVS